MARRWACIHAGAWLKVGQQSFSILSWKNCAQLGNPCSRHVCFAEMAQSGDDQPPPRSSSTTLGERPNRTSPPKEGGEAPYFSLRLEALAVGEARIGGVRGACVTSATGELEPS
jgi:hypothetical protein